MIIDPDTTKYKITVNTAEVMETKTIVGVPITIGGVGFTSDHAKNLKITVGPFDCEKSA